MKLTNKYGLPTAIANAVKGFQDDYTNSHTKKSDISVTGLLAPPQQKALTSQHETELTEDVSDRIWALMGQSIHSLLEKAETKASVEDRLYGTYDGWIVSGQYDRMTCSEKTLQDYKFCSVWEVIYGLKEDRIAQLNILAQLAIDNGHDVTHLEVVAIFRDWQKKKAKNDRSYPQSQVKRIKVPLWDEQKRLEYISERIDLHRRVVALASRGDQDIGLVEIESQLVDVALPNEMHLVRDSVVGSGSAGVASATGWTDIDSTTTGYASAAIDGSGATAVLSSSSGFHVAQWNSPVTPDQLMMSSGPLFNGNDNYSSYDFSISFY